MANLGATKLSGAKLTGEVVGRVLRTRSAKAVQPSAKLVDSKITFKVTKGAKVVVDKDNPSAKREAGAATESGGVEQGKKPRKTSKKTIVAVAVEESETVGAFGLGSGFVEKVTVSSSRSEAWSISLSTADAIAEATQHLVVADTKLAQIIGVHGGCPGWQHNGDCFSALARSIVYQQLSGKAAFTIYGRLVALCGVLHTPPLCSSQLSKFSSCKCGWLFCHPPFNF